MLLVVVALLLSAEPDRYLGGAAPTPLVKPGPVDTSPSGQACSTLTLQRSSACFFDGRPAAVEAGAARKKQAAANIELARSLGRGVCVERLSKEVLDAQEKQRRLAACAEGTTRASIACSLEGVEVLLDAEGRFSEKGRACYEALAVALQAAEIPPVPKEPASAPPMSGVPR